MYKNSIHCFYLYCIIIIIQRKVKRENKEYFQIYLQTSKKLTQNVDLINFYKQIIIIMSK